ncbi:MAG TPA: hypothetical protein VIH40_11325 [Xanthobacteraceae bacterium]
MSEDADQRPGPCERTAAAAYVAELSSDLARLARRHGLDTLSFILEMARLEAETAAQQSQVEAAH